MVNIDGEEIGTPFNHPQTIEIRNLLNMFGPPQRLRFDHSNGHFQNNKLTNPPKVVTLNLSILVICLLNHLAFFGHKIRGIEGS